MFRVDYRIRASLTPGQLVFSVALLPADDEPAAGPTAEPGTDAEEAR